MLFKKVPVLKIEHIKSDYFILKIRDNELTQDVKPGQFFQVKDTAAANPLLPRPFSVYKVNDDILEFLIKIVGRATMNLSKIEKGHIIQILGPLGNGFTLVKNKKVLLVSGGIGYAPMPYLEQMLNQNDNKVQFYHGGRNKKDIICDDVENCADDGSFGLAGFVTEYAEKYVDSNPVNVVYACGPEPMMKLLTSICKRRNIPIYVSLERVMACGVGACCGCVISVEENGKTIYKKVCKDGPVFDGSKVVWDA